MRTTLQALGTVATVAAPVTTFAQVLNVPPGVVTFMDNVTREIINPMIAIIFALALVYFMYGLMSFIFSAGDETKRVLGKQHMVWGTIGMTIMVSVFGLLQLMLLTFGVNQAQTPQQLPLWNVSEDF